METRRRTSRSNRACYVHRERVANDQFLDRSDRKIIHVFTIPVFSSVDCTRLGYGSSISYAERGDHSHRSELANVGFHVGRYIHVHRASKMHPSDVPCGVVETHTCITDTAVRVLAQSSICTRQASENKERISTVSLHMDHTEARPSAETNGSIGAAHRV